MNFFNPLMFEATSRNNTQSTTSGTDIPRYLSGYVPTHVAYREYEPSVQFKVFAFDKVNSGSLNLGEASNVYRFELLENRSFTGFLNVLKSHGISTQSHKFNYVDDEQDLIVLSNEYDFKYMLKILKGKTIKIVCEKIPQPTAFSCPRAQRPNCAGFRNLPFFMHPTREREQESEEKLLEQALDSVFSGIFEKKPERPQQNPINTQRVRTIRLSDLLKEASAQKEEEKPEKKEEKKRRTFEDYLAELFGMKLAERRSQEEQSNKQTKEEKAATEQKVSTEEKKEETIKEESQQVEETPVLTTSQIISNYLIGDEDDVITEDESEESEDDMSSVTSEPVNQEVQYPTLRQEEEPTTSIPETINQEQPSYETELKLLSDMGFSDQSENLKLLTKYSGDVQRAVSELIYYY